MENIIRLADPGRSSEDEINARKAIVKSHELLGDIFSLTNSIGAILDKNRQIVYANNDFVKTLGYDSLEDLLGKRPGEAISCIHSAEERAGCGTSEACTICGAVNAIIDSQKTQQKTVREAQITSSQKGHDKSWDFRITSVPIKFSGEDFYIFTLDDISDEKRRYVLERIFFHDILNTAGGLNGLLMILKSGTNPEEARKLIDQSEEASRNLIEEILLQRQIRAAENGDLNVNIERLDLLRVLNDATDMIRYHESAIGKIIVIDQNSIAIELKSDRILLQRVLINLLKNALEATPQGGTVTAGCLPENSSVVFYVHSAADMPKEIQLQIFQRSFSTKGKGRGFGTYSIKLLTENYLNGHVSFVSNKSEGTVFYIKLDEEGKRK
ncbi:MAG: HAMP domain-containing sensor histidine kinase [Bacteroidales bacterium]|jgi:K+-sensing histidine kinase KdpD